MIKYYNIIKIFELLSWNYYFSNILNYIKKYINICDIYVKKKIFKYIFYNKLMFLFILIEFWKNISYDYIINLSKSYDYDIILIFINWFIKINYFIFYIKIIIISNFIKIFLNYIIYFHEFSDSIILNYKVIFILKFWKILSMIINIK